MSAANAKVIQIETLSRVREYLERDPIGTAYQRGDLGEAYRDFSQWYAYVVNDAIETMLLIYTGLSMPVIITHGQSEGVSPLLEAFKAQLPGRAMVHADASHLSALDGVFACDSIRPMLRMGMHASELQSAQTYLEDEILKLGMRDTGDIIELFQYYPDHFFEPAQLMTGHYYGVRRDGKLVSVAGVHVFSKDASVACLGNIVTHPSFRGQGLSTGCTEHLCKALIDEGVQVLALNVDRHNRSAVRVYEKLGFKAHMSYIEGTISLPFIPGQT